MLDRLYWYNLNIVKSVYLSKNYCDAVQDIPEINTVKIRVFLSKKMLRSTILAFWFLFIIFGGGVAHTKLQKPSKKFKGLGSKQSMCSFEYSDKYTMFAFVDVWLKNLSSRSLIYLKKNHIAKGYLFLQYSKILRPKRYPTLVYLDKGCDYFISKVGFFQLIMTLGSTAYIKNQDNPPKIDLLESEVLEALDKYNEMYSKESTIFYLKSFKLL